MKNNKKISVNSLIAISALLIVSCFSIGFGALSSTLEINGIAHFGTSNLVYIDSVSPPVLLNNATEVDTISYLATSTTTNVSLPNLDSTATYYITLRNGKTNVQQFTGIRVDTSNNENVTYELSGLDTDYLLETMSEATIGITFKYKDTVTTIPENTTAGYIINYEFQLYVPPEVSTIMPYIDENNSSGDLLLNLRGFDAITTDNKWIDTMNNEISLSGEVGYSAVNKAYIFDGSNDYGEASQAVIPETGDFTVEVYLKTQNSEFVSKNEDQAIISQMSNTLPNASASGRFKINIKWTTDISPAQFVTFHGSSSTVTTKFNDNAEAISLATNYHLQIVRSGGQMYYYVNGEKTKTKSFSSTLKILQVPLKIAKWSNSDGQFFKGYIYAVRVYNRALNDTELSSNYQADIENYNYILPIVSTDNIKNMALTYNYNADGMGLYPDGEGRLVYRGSNPSNYVKIITGYNESNEEISKLYRIMSFETDGTMKLIDYYNPIEHIAWDTAGSRVDSPYCTNAAIKGCNAWKTYTEYTYNSNNQNLLAVNSPSSLLTYLNETYLNSLDTNFIDNLVDGTYYIGQLAEQESYTSAKVSEKNDIWVGTIGLPSAINFEEAGLTVTSIGTIGITDNYLTALAENKNTDVWTITPALENNFDVWIALSSSSLSKRMASRTYQIINASAEDIDSNRMYFYAHATFNLHDNLEVTGDGTFVSPYIIDFS